MHPSTDTYKQNLLPPTHPAINEKVNLRVVDSVITMHGFYGTNDPKVKISGSEKPFFTMKRNQSEIIKVSTVRVISLKKIRTTGILLRLECECTMGWKRLRCSGTLTRKNTTVNTDILINSQSRMKYCDQHGTTRQPNRRIQIGTVVWETEVRHLEDSTHKVTGFLRLRHPEISLRGEVFK